MYRRAIFLLLLLWVQTDVVAARARLAAPALTGAYTAVLGELVEQADRIVWGRVRTVHSFWTLDHRTIESEVVLDVAYTLGDKVDATLIINTPGGYLADEGIGLRTLHAADFTVDEEVLLLLRQGGAAWQMVGGAAGKFSIQGEWAVNPDLALAQPFDMLLALLEEMLNKQGRLTTLSATWGQLEMEAQPVQAQPGPLQAGEFRWPTPHAQAKFWVNINTEQVGNETKARLAFRKAILDVAATWSSVENADFDLLYAGETTTTQTSYNGLNEVLFMHKGAAERAAAAQVWYTAEGEIVEADIWINDDYAWNATGAPAVHEVDLQSALLHEFGHWLILGHFNAAEAVMYFKLASGIHKRQLQQPDVRGIQAIYPP
jgi:hypothetical protein